MKAVMLSIHPKWVEKIASREKTVEVRKTVPKCGTPFKVYMYCGKGKPFLYKNANNNEIFIDSDLYRGGDYEERFLSGKVVGEFVCDCITDYWANNTGFEAEGRDPFYMPCGYAEKATCLTYEQFVEYGKGAPLFGLHISDLKIYDKPKELSEFWTIKCNKRRISCGECDYKPNCIKGITRPPQSWQFVEEL